MKTNQSKCLSGRILILLLIAAMGSCRAKPEQGLDPEPSATAEKMADVQPELEVEIDPPADDQEAVIIDECLVCHSDQQELQDTAAPVELVGSESSGEG